MRVVIQRVTGASVTVDGKVTGAISKGLLLLIGVDPDDDRDDLEWMCRKVLNMRIFDDENGDMNLSVHDVAGELLAVSQFTLHASTKKGNRPSFVKAAPPDEAEKIYNEFTEILRRSGLKTATGIFGARMQVELNNDGPVTIIMDSKNKE